MWEKEIVRESITLERLKQLAQVNHGYMIKAVADLGRGIIAVGGEWHADAEAILLDDGSQQQDLWGFNILFGEGGHWELEYNSLINIRPTAGNRSMDVQDPVLREKIRVLVAKKVTL